MLKSDPKDPVNPVSLKLKAYTQILDRILSGEAQPGTLFSRRQLAESLGMSLAPVHEAMLMLENEGFVEALPRIGTQVRTVRREEVRGHLVLREALECQVARMICGERVRDRMKDLRKLAKEVDREGKSENHRAEKEVAFHGALAELADCPALTREYLRIMRIGWFYRISLLMGTPAKGPVRKHEDLLEALAVGNKDQAENAVRDHIWSGKPVSL